MPLLRHGIFILNRTFSRPATAKPLREFLTDHACSGSTLLDSKFASPSDPLPRVSAPLFRKIKLAFLADDHRGRRIRAIVFSVGVSGAARIVSMACMLLQVPLAIGSLGSEGFGLWMALTSAVSLLAFADLGMGNGIQNRVATAHGNDDPEAIRRAYVSGVVLLTGIGTLLLLVALFTLPWVNWAQLFGVREKSLHPSVPWAFAWTVLGFCVGLPFTSVQKLLLGLQKGWVLGIANLFSSAATLGLVALCSWTHAGLAAFVGLTTIPLPLANLVLGLWLHRTHSHLRISRKGVSRQEIRCLASLGGQFFIPQLGAAILYSAPSLIISNVLGAAALTPFNLCQRIFGIFQQVQHLALAPLWPAYAEARERNDYLWVRHTFLLSWVGSAVALFCFCAVLLGMGSQIFAAWVGTTSSLPSPSLIHWFALWTFVGGLGIPLAYLLNGLGQLRGVILYGSINLCASLAGMLILVHFWGVPGVVASLSISYIIFVVPANYFDVALALRKVRYASHGRSTTQQS